MPEKKATCAFIMLHQVKVDTPQVDINGIIGLNFYLFHLIFAYFENKKTKKFGPNL